LNKKDNLQKRLHKAEEIVQLYKSLDYAAIVRHESAAVAGLREVLRVIRPPSAQPRDELSNYAGVEVAPKGAMHDVGSAERRRAYVEALSVAGLGQRLGRVYSSTAETRVVAFRDVPHRIGLPDFQLVVAADYSPQAGYHGIFVNAQEVVSCLLAAPGEQPWQTRERHRFASVQQMVEMVGLLSAGFPVE